MISGVPRMVSSLISCDESSVERSGRPRHNPTDFVESVRSRGDGDEDSIKASRSRSSRARKRRCPRRQHHPTTEGIHPGHDRHPKTCRAGQAEPDQANRRGPQARRQALDRMGRQAHRLRRPRPALRRQGLPRQLPHRRRRPQGAQQAGRHRPLRQDIGGAGQARGPQGPGRGRERRRSGRRARPGPRHAHPATGLRGLHEGQPQPGAGHGRDLPHRLQASSREPAHAPARQHRPARRGGAVQTASARSAAGR